MNFNLIENDLLFYDKSIITKNFSLGECTIGHENRVKPCFSTSCSWFYSIEAMSGVGTCENADSNALPRLDIMTEIRMFTKPNKEKEETKLNRAIFKHYSSIQFWCQLNNCNNQDIGETVKKIIIERYDLWTMDTTYKLNEI